MKDIHIQFNNSKKQKGNVPGEHVQQTNLCQWPKKRENQMSEIWVSIPFSCCLLLAPKPNKPAVQHRFEELVLNRTRSLGPEWSWASLSPDQPAFITGKKELILKFRIYRIYICNFNSIFYMNIKLKENGLDLDLCGKWRLGRRSSASWRRAPSPATVFTRILTSQNNRSNHLGFQCWSRETIQEEEIKEIMRKTAPCRL